MDIVACLLAPWSSGKDPDRYTGEGERLRPVRVPPEEVLAT
jgi:hypothetical protein